MIAMVYVNVHKIERVKDTFNDKIFTNRYARTFVFTILFSPVTPATGRKIKGPTKRFIIHV